MAFEEICNEVLVEQIIASEEIAIDIATRRIPVG
jgi:hypothetical protein